jgi:hypothetical protein
LEAPQFWEQEDGATHGWVGYGAAYIRSGAVLATARAKVLGHRSRPREDETHQLGFTMPATPALRSLQPRAVYCCGSCTEGQQWALCTTFLHPSRQPLEYRLLITLLCDAGTRAADDDVVLLGKEDLLLPQDLRWKRLLSLDGGGLRGLITCEC